MTIAVAYLRCSDPKQDKSVDQQREAIEERARKDGVTIVEWFADDGISGLTVADRPGLLGLRGWAAALPPREQASTRIVYAWAQSRLGRNVAETMTTLATLDAAGVETRFLTDHEPADVDTRDFLRAIRSTFDAQHSRRLSKDVPRGMRDAARDGRWPFGLPPFGYTVHHDAHDRSGRLVVNPVQANIVREVFALYLAGNGDTATAAILTARGVIPPENTKVLRARGAGTWYAKNVADMVTNPVYTGQIVFKGEVAHAAAHEAIIELDCFDRLQAYRRSKDRNKVRANPITNGSRGLLLPFLRCGHCGGRMLVQHGAKGRFHYACAVRARQKTACEGVNAPIDLADELGWSAIVEQILQPGVILRAAERWHAAAATEGYGELPARRAAIEARIGAADAAIRRAASMVMDGLVTQADAAPGLRLHSAAREAARDELRLLPVPRKLPELTAWQVNEFCERVLVALRAKPIEERRKALKQLISAVVLKPGQLTVTYRPRLVVEPEVTTSGGPDGSW